MAWVSQVQKLRLDLTDLGVGSAAPLLFTTAVWIFSWATAMVSRKVWIGVFRRTLHLFRTEAAEQWQRATVVA